MGEPRKISLGLTDVLHDDVEPSPTKDVEGLVARCSGEVTTVIWMRLLPPCGLCLLLLAAPALSEDTKHESPPPSSSSLLFLGSGLQDAVLDTAASCPELFGLDGDPDVPPRSLLCRVLLSLRQPQAEVSARGYYGGPAYHTYVSGFEPMTLLAGLAFLAFLLQTLHALLYRNPPASTPVAISRASRLRDDQLTRSVTAAVDKYENLNEERGLQSDGTWSRIGRVLSQFWPPRRSPSCGSSILCRLLSKLRQRRHA